MLVKQIIADMQGTSRVMGPGDNEITNDVVPAANTSTALTVLASMLAGTIFLSNPGGAATYTLDTATNLQAGLAPFYNYNLNAQVPAGSAILSGIQPGTSFRVRFVNASANAITVAATANTGVTVNRGSIAASTSRDMLVTFNNGTPGQTYAGGTTNTSAVVQLTPAQVQTLSVGMIVTNAVNGLQGTTIISCNINAGTVTMSGNANATSSAPGVAIAFSPVVTIDML